MNNQAFKHIKDAIQALVEAKEYNVARRLLTTFVNGTATPAQRAEAANIITPKQEVKSSSERKPIDMTALYAEYGDAEQKKRVAVLAQPALAESGSVLETPETVEDQPVDDIQSTDKVEPDQVEIIETVSWVNRASDSAIELANEYPDLDYSSLTDKEKITVYDIRAIVKAQVD